MMVAFWVFSFLGLFFLFANTAAYESCKEIAEAAFTGPNPQSSEYTIIMKNGLQFNVYCEFGVNGVGYSYLRPENRIDFSLIADGLQALSNDNSGVLLKFVTAQGQFESEISPLSKYFNFKFVKLINRFDSYASPLTTPNYFYLGLVPRVLISGRGLDNGYKVWGREYVQSTCDTQGNSYFLLDPKPGQSQRIMEKDHSHRPWYVNRAPASHAIPWYFFFSWTESINCLPLVQDWGLNIGFKFTYSQPCSVPVVNVIDCQRHGGQCKKVDCKENTCAKPYLDGLCGSYEGEYKCCNPNLPTEGTCKFVGDPHILTFDGNFYDNHELNWFYAVRACDWSWELRAFFDFSVAPTWTIFSVMELRIQGTTTFLYVNRLGDAAFNLQQVVQNYRVFSFNAGNYFIFTRPQNFANQRTQSLTIETNFGVYIEITPPDNTQLIIKLKPRWFGNTCGLCGPWDNNPGNDFAYAFNSQYGRKRRETEEPKTLVRRQSEDCTGVDLINAQQYCQNALAADSGNCGTVPTYNYEEFCIFDHCLGGEEFANYSLGSFRTDCYPPKRSTCSMCGFRQIEMFDDVKYYYLGSECDYDFVHDCSGNNDFAVVISLKKQKLGGKKELLLARVKITYKSHTIHLIRSGNSVKVDNDDVTVDYTSGDNQIIVTFSGHLVTVRTLTLTVSYNFKQMLKVEVVEEYYNNTCGLCGSWNDDESDEITTGDSFQLDSCDVGVVSTPCPSNAAQIAAENLCAGSLADIPCNDLDKSEFLERCAHEFCEGGYKMLCQHVLEFIDKCFWVTGKPSLLDIEPESCKVCLPPKRRGGGGGGGNAEPLVMATPNACDQSNGACLDERCEQCPTAFIDGLCPGTRKKCCIGI